MPDILGIFKEQFPEAKIAPNQNYVEFRCPFCATDPKHQGHKHLMYVNIHNGLAKCFACGFEERKFMRVLKVLNIRITLKENVLSYLSPKGGKVLTRTPLLPSNIRSNFGLVPLRDSLAGKAYWEKRGFTPEDITPTILFGENGSPDARFQNKIVFSCWPEGLTGRNILVKEFASYTPPNLPGMFYLPRPETSEDDQIILVEGPFDAHRLMKFGFFAAAVLGKKVPTRINEFLRIRKIREVYFWLDPDAFNDTFNLIQKINRPYRYLVNYHKEPDDCSESEAREALQLTEPFSFKQIEEHELSKNDLRFQKNFQEA